MQAVYYLSAILIPCIMKLPFPLPQKLSVMRLLWPCLAINLFQCIFAAGPYLAPFLIGASCVWPLYLAPKESPYAKGVLFAGAFVVTDIIAVLRWYPYGNARHDDIILGLISGCEILAVIITLLFLYTVPQDTEPVRTRQHDVLSAATFVGLVAVGKLLVAGVIGLFGG